MSVATSGARPSTREIPDIAALIRATRLIVTGARVPAPTWLTKPFNNASTATETLYLFVEGVLFPLLNQT
jgi:hypothetical protein